SASACASRNSAQLLSPSARLLGGAAPKLGSCTNRNGRAGSPPAARQDRIINGNSVRYSYARAALLSPWYQITPATGRRASGAIMPFQSTDGLSGSSTPITRGRVEKSASAGGSLRSIL